MLRWFMDLLWGKEKKDFEPQTYKRLLESMRSMQPGGWSCGRCCARDNAVHPHAVLSFPDAEGMEPLSEQEIERIRVEFEELYNKGDGKGRLFVTPPGSELKLLDGGGSLSELRNYIENLEERDKKRDEEFKRGWDRLCALVQKQGFGDQVNASGFKIYKGFANGARRYISPEDPPEGGRPVRPYDLFGLLTEPNADEAWLDYLQLVEGQLLTTGTALTWMVPNTLGIPHELYVIPTAQAIPQPSLKPDYPDGYYRIQPPLFLRKGTNAAQASIPAQWVLRMQASTSEFDLASRRAKIGRYLTRTLAPFFGDGLVVELV